MSLAFLRRESKACTVSEVEEGKCGVMAEANVKDSDVVKDLGSVRMSSD